MANSRNKVYGPRPLIDAILKRSKKRTHGGGNVAPGATFTYWEISPQSAKTLVQQAYGPQARPPRLGYETVLPETKKKDDHGSSWRGKWIVSHERGKYELRFSYGSDRYE